MTVPEAGGCGAPRVSVVIPTYNYADFLGDAIESVLGQTYRDLELLVLDNASTDRTPEVAGAYADARLRYVRNPENLGYPANANRGLTLARGELLLYVGGDDVLEPSFLETAVGHLDAHPGLSCVHGAAVWIDETGAPFGQSGGRWAPVTRGEEAFLDFFRYGFCLSTVVMRTDTARRVGGLNPQWGDIADAWLFLRLCLVGDVGYLAEPLVRYRVHTRSLSTSLYRRGEFFRQQVRLAQEAFEWPEARRPHLFRRRRAALRYLAREGIRALHLVRKDGTRGDFLTAFWDAVAVAPDVAFYPSTWARLTFGLMPRSVILALQRWRRRRTSRAEADRRPVTAACRPGLP